MSSTTAERDSLETVDDAVIVGRATVVEGARWTFLSLLSKQASRIVFSVLLARMLGPESFGIIGQATIYLAFSSVILDVGLGATIIQRERLDRRDIGTATVVNLAIVGVLVALTEVGAGVWATFFETPELAAVLRVLAATFLLNGLAIVPRALLVRRLRFKLLGAAEVAASIVAGAVALLGAHAGLDHWALVVQTLLTDAILLTVLLAVTGRPVLAWSRRALSDMAAFSRNVFGTQLLGFASQHSDNLLIAWHLGTTALAHYALSYRTLMLPVQILAHAANRVVFPVLSRLNAEPERQARYFLRITSTLALAVTPLMVLGALAAPTAVPLVFGDAWAPAARAMQVLAVASIVRVVLTPSSALLMARDKTAWLFRWNLAAVPLHVAGFAVGLQWGIEGVAWSYLLVGLPLGAILNELVRRVVPITAPDYVRSIRPAVSGGLAMVGAWAASDALIGASTGLAALATHSTASVAAFAVAVRLTEPDVVRTQLSFVRSALGRDRPEVTT